MKDKIRARKEELYKIKEDITKEITELQEACDHSEHIVCWCGDIRNHHPGRVCSICDKLLTGVTPEEIKTFYAEENKRNRENWENKFPRQPYPENSDLVYVEYKEPEVFAT